MEKIKIIFMATNKSDGDTRMTILYTRFVTQYELKICGNLS